MIGKTQNPTPAQTQTKPLPPSKAPQAANVDGVRVPIKWGFCFAGNEGQFTAAVVHTIRKQQGKTWRYLEIGLAKGDCLRAVAGIAAQATDNYELYGVDLPGSPSLSLSRYAPEHRDHITLSDLSSEVFLMDCTTRFNYVFIDGCHGKPCAMRDFKMVEPLVEPGGIVCFHDTSEWCQGRHWQHHCRSNINVRAAVKELGLLDDTRPGWKKYAETEGNSGANGHGSLWVIRGD